MAEPIEVHTQARVIDGPNIGRVINVALRYDPAAPYAVAMAFSEVGVTQVWQVARELLACGLHGLSGQGDVQVFPFTDPPGVGLYLSSPDGFCLLRLAQESVATLLARSYIAVPAGRESEWMAGSVDAAVAALLDGATP